MRVPVATGTPASAAPVPDSVSAYLASPLISKTEIDRMGGLLGYWSYELARGSPLARMALDILTAPGTYFAINTVRFPLIYCHSSLIC
jgi:hypothetical protein